MPRLKLTQRTVEKLPAPDPSARQVLHWDTAMRGFGVLCSGKTNAKTYVVQRDLPDGRTRRVTIAAANVISLDEARRRAQATLAELYRGVDPRISARGSTTLRKVLEDYLASRPLRETTKEEYRRGVERHLKPWLDRPLKEITPEMVEARHRAIATEIEAAGRHGGEPTANGVMRTFRLIWNYAAERDADFPMNPVRRLRRQWYPERKRERVVRAEELSRFYKGLLSLPNPVARDYLLLLLFTGLRRREAASLKWEHVDFTHCVIRLPAANTKSGRKLDLPMTDVVHDLLMTRRTVGNDGPFVFSAQSKSGHIEEPAFPLTQLATSTGIRVSAHDLRRTFVTAAESTDISPLALSALVNHSLGRDVTSGYVIMTAERLRGPAQRVCDRIKTLCGITG
jgi:integrase